MQNHMGKIRELFLGLLKAIKKRFYQRNNNQFEKKDTQQIPIHAERNFHADFNQLLNNFREQTEKGWVELEVAKTKFRNSIKRIRWQFLKWVEVEKEKINCDYAFIEKAKIVAIAEIESWKEKAKNEIDHEYSKLVSEKELLAKNRNFEFEILKSINFQINLFINTNEKKQWKELVFFIQGEINKALAGK